jgi:hypothetical protein
VHLLMHARPLRGNSAPADQQEALELTARGCPRLGVVMPWDVCAHGAGALTEAAWVTLIGGAPAEEDGISTAPPHPGVRTMSTPDVEIIGVSPHDCCAEV